MSSQRILPAVQRGFREGQPGTTRPTPIHLTNSRCSRRPTQNCYRLLSSGHHSAHHPLPNCRLRLANLTIMLYRIWPSPIGWSLDSIDCLTACNEPAPGSVRYRQVCFRKPSQEWSSRSLGSVKVRSVEKISADQTSSVRPPWNIEQLPATRPEYTSHHAWKTSERI
ncbi:hypothetical protein M011DRAFT_57115 [Sporormia fimetaria CBS 119925]|uniref:Uncharacterized protein n=1 Tax=Sporormia fimetaria CBS 119925 TaxID=1340428 RepID=A0A6A6VCB7_9PLEO|nr:hypothetical protein M011DRAFT_57115 [Sporormia fimetaria CBS 119925]